MALSFVQLQVIWHFISLRAKYLYQMILNITFMLENVFEYVPIWFPGRRHSCRHRFCHLIRLCLSARVFFPHSCLSWMSSPSSCFSSSSHDHWSSFSFGEMVAIDQTDYKRLRWLQFGKFRNPCHVFSVI